MQQQDSQSPSELGHSVFNALFLQKGRGWERKHAEQPETTLWPLLFLVTFLKIDFKKSCNFFFALFVFVEISLEWSCFWKRKLHISNKRTHFSRDLQGPKSLKTLWNLPILAIYIYIYFRIESYKFSRVKAITHLCSQTVSHHRNDGFYLPALLVKVTLKRRDLEPSTVA